MTPALTALLMHHSQLAPFRKRQSNVAVKVICIFIYVHTRREMTNGPSCHVIFGFAKY